MMSIAIPRLPPGVLVCVFSPRCSTTSQSFAPRDHKSKPCISPPWHQGLRERPFGCHSPLWGHTPWATAAPSCLGNCPPGPPLPASAHFATPAVVPGVLLAEAAHPARQHGHAGAAARSRNIILCKGERQEVNPQASKSSACLCSVSSPG